MVIGNRWTKTVTWTISRVPLSVVTRCFLTPSRRTVRVKTSPKARAESSIVSYNRASEGDHRHQYYLDKRASYPPDIERDPDKQYVFRV